MEAALRVRATKMRTKSEAAHRRRQKILKERLQRRQLLIERSRLEGLRRLWSRRNQITQLLARPLCAANTLRSSTRFQCVVSAARDGYCPPDPFTALSATHLAYADVRTTTAHFCLFLRYGYIPTTASALCYNRFVLARYIQNSHRNGTFRTS